MPKLGRQRIRRVRRDPWLRFRVGIGFLGLVLVVGTTGYMMLGLDAFDAAYQTVITVSTVGYRELGIVDRTYEVFTIFLILFGTGTVLYTLGVLLETLFEGQLDDLFQRQRMQRRIDELEGHVIVCGYGQVGRSIVAEMDRAGKDVVIVDRQSLDLDELPDGVELVTGEATDDEILELAGLHRAGTLVVALDNDADTLYVSLTARTENDDLFIIARANSGGVVEKLGRVGVDRVVNPHEIGGSRMAAMVLQPDVTDFLDVVMHDLELEVRMAEITATERNGYVGSSVADLLAGDEPTATTLVAVRRDGRFITNPPRDLEIELGDILIVLGTDDHIRSLIDN